MARKTPRTREEKCVAEHCEMVADVIDINRKKLNKSGQVAHIEGFLLANAAYYDFAAYPKRWQMGQMKHCFDNAQRLVMRRPELTYCEGYAFSVVFPMLHAWAVDADGRVYDPTWPSGAAYFGVAIPTARVRERRRTNTDNLSHLDDYPKWPMIYGPGGLV